MPGLIDKQLDRLKVIEVHPKYGAEISGLDFSKPIADNVFEQVLAASAKITIVLYCSRYLLSLSRSQRGRISDQLVVWCTCIPEHWS
jgi:hypothetical protein